jgi:hypothetical protein
MTCEDVREHLLTADVGDLDPVRSHLSGCARCAELAAAVAHTESDLRQHVETFVNSVTLDAQWAQALDRAGPPAPSPRALLHKLVLAAATAAVLAVLLVPALRSPGSGGPPEPPGERLLGVGVVPEALREARDRVGAFQRLDTEHLDVAGLDRDAEDQRMRGALQGKVEALARAEEALTAATSSGEPRWRVLAWRELGALQAEMAEALRRFPAPSYLDEPQRARYAEAIADRVAVQQGKAASTYAQGADLARQHALEAMARELEALAERQALRALRARLEASASCVEPEAADRLRGLLDEAERALEPDTSSRLAAELDLALAACR